MYAYPTASSAYRLTAGDSFYPTRRNGPVLGIVLHVTAGLQDTDMVGPDVSAEGTAKWAVSSGAEVSWHVGVDSDSIVPCLPDTYTGWHAKGYNSRSWGIEISNRDAAWGNKPANWVDATLHNAARACAPIVKKYDLPLELSSRATVDSRIAANRPFGFTYHSLLSDIRTDPGKDFPWSRFITLVRAELAGTAPQEDDEVTPQDIKDITAAFLTAKAIPANMLVTNPDPDNPNLVTIPRALDLVMRWSLEGRDNAIAARSIAAAQAELGRPLTAQEITDAAEQGVRDALNSAAEITVTVKPQGVQP